MEIYMWTGNDETEIYNSHKANKTFENVSKFKYPTKKQKIKKMLRFTLKLETSEFMRSVQLFGLKLLLSPLRSIILWTSCTASYFNELFSTTAKRMKTKRLGTYQYIRGTMQLVYEGHYITRNLNIQTSYLVLSGY